MAQVTAIPFFLLATRNSSVFLSSRARRLGCREKDPTRAASDENAQRHFGRECHGVEER